MSDEATIETVEPHGATGLPYAAQDIRTERLLLRALNNGDLDDMHAYQTLKDVVRYQSWEVHDHEESAKRLKKRLATSRLEKDGEGIVYAVELPDPAGGHSRVIGDISLFLKSAAWGKFEVGWVFHPAFHGQGYATEAAEAILSLCFDQLGAHRVFAQLDARNETSARLCERVGMQREALLRETEIVKGEWADTAVYALVEHEYQLKRSTAAG